MEEEARAAERIEGEIQDFFANREDTLMTCLPTNNGDELGQIYTYSFIELR